MKNLLFLFAIVALSLSDATSQTFTVAQSSTGTTLSCRGQSFTPSAQGSGSGSMGTKDTVQLDIVSLMIDDATSPDTLYLYEQLPDSTFKLDNAQSGKLVGKSYLKIAESYWYTNYYFGGLGLDKNTKYYAVFKSNVNIEIGCAGYTGGGIVVNTNDTLAETSCDTRFIVSFTPSPSNATDIDSFSVESQVGSSIINKSNHSITVTVNNTAILNGLSATITTSEGATYTPKYNYYNFSNGPVTITVTAKDKTSKQDWLINVTKEASSNTELISFTLPEQKQAASIYYGNKRVEITVVAGTTISALIPSIEVSKGATIVPNSGVANDFSSGQVVYKITAEDGKTTENWTVVLSVDKSNAVQLTLADQQYSVYPTLCTDKLNIEQAFEKEATVVIYNSLGVQVMYTGVYSKMNAIDISSFQKGIYLVKVLEATKPLVFKVIKN